MYKSYEHGKVHSDSLCSLTGAYTVCDVFTLKYPLPKEKNAIAGCSVFAIFLIAHFKLYSLVLYLYGQLVQL